MDESVVTLEGFPAGVNVDESVVMIVKDGGPEVPEDAVIVKLPAPLLGLEGWNWKSPSPWEIGQAWFEGEG